MFQMGGSKPAKSPPGADVKVRPARAPRRSAVTVHLDAAERRQFEALGGEAWLREQLQRSADAAGA